MIYYLFIQILFRKSTFKNHLLIVISMKFISSNDKIEHLDNKTSKKCNLWYIVWIKYYCIQEVKYKTNVSNINETEKFVHACQTHMKQDNAILYPTQNIVTENKRQEII